MEAEDPEELGALRDTVGMLSVPPYLYLNMR